MEDALAREYANCKNPSVGCQFTRLRGKAMTDDPSQSNQTAPEVARKPLSPAAQRALAEAEARREAASAAEPLPKEFQGPQGPEPTRYGDWEKKGIASDF
jgi:hypothetical protein